MFWDRDRDGVIWPQDTFIGFYELGFNLFFSFLATLVINLNFSYPTRLGVSYIPDPYFRLYLPSMHKAKHGSDSGTYDKEGRFVPQAFEDMFSKWDRGDKGALSAGELWDMIAANRLAADPFGWAAGIFEFGVTWLLVQQDGMVDKEDLRRIYDVSISSLFRIGLLLKTILTKCLVAGLHVLQNQGGLPHRKGMEQGFWPPRVL